MPRDLDTLLKEKRIFKPSKNSDDETNIKKWMETQDIQIMMNYLKEQVKIQNGSGMILQGNLNGLNHTEKLLNGILPMQNGF